MILEKIPELQHLTAKEKIILAEELWADAGDAGAELPPTEEHIKILEERWQNYLDDPNSASTWEEVKKRLRKS